VQSATGVSNTAGANLTITGSQGTGTGAGGSIIFQVAPAGSTGSAQNSLSTALTIASTGAVSVGSTLSLLPATVIFTDWNGYFGWSGGTSIRHNSSTEAIRLIFGGTEMVEFGGSTSSFPALKRSSTILQTKLADDSAYAPFEANTIRTATAYTVATLPAAGSAGRRAYVTDATAPTFLGALTGGGAVVCPVFDNGTAWVSA
jgi:hypothetical protein